MPEDREPFLDACRVCPIEPPAVIFGKGAAAWSGGEVPDWLRVCDRDGGGAFDEKVLDLGLPGRPRVGDDGEARANGLFRLDIEPGPLLKDIMI